MDEFLSTTTSSDAVSDSTLRSCLIRVVPLLVSSRARTRNDSIPLCCITSSTWPDTMFGTARRTSSFSAINCGPNMLPMVKIGDVNFSILVVVLRSLANGHFRFDVSGDHCRPLLPKLQTLSTFPFVSSSALLRVSLNIAAAHLILVAQPWSACSLCLLSVCLVASVVSVSQPRQT